MKKVKILVADPISPKGISELEKDNRLEVVVQIGLKPDKLLEIIGEYEGLIVRSETKVTSKVLDAATQLKVVGRAGVGVDNVDLDSATRKGVVVMNTPDGNTTSTAEHAFSLLVSLARPIPQAHASVSSGKWERSKFQGVELYGKTLGILGMGRIGTELARRAIAFGMRVLAYDPYLSASRARSVQVELIEDINELLSQADFISLHLPLTAETRHILNAQRLAQCKKGVRIVNCARGGLIDETALHEQLEKGHVAGAALDVYETEPPPAEFILRSHPKVVLTPHLGASTAEAQESVGIEIAQAVRAMLLDGIIKNSVNVPNLDSKTLEIIGPYLTLGHQLGKFLSEIAQNKRTDWIKINYSGRVNEGEVAPITRTVIQGFLETAEGVEVVNSVNALSRAKERGIQVSETRLNAPGEFTDLLEISAGSGNNSDSVSGTFFGSKPRIVQINGHYVEAKPDGVLLILENRDVPGIVGTIGTLLGKRNINIARMSLSREAIGGRVLSVLNLDSTPDETALKEILKDPDILTARIAKL